jgi:LAS superfamily LD-carboxypeptidase LdcB
MTVLPAVKAPTTVGGLEGLDSSFSGALMRMILASGGRLRINSGYRSVERQTELWNAALKKYGSPEAARRWVAPPGHSNHNRGIAADLAGDLGWHINMPASTACRSR